MLVYDSIFEVECATLSTMSCVLYGIGIVMNDVIIIIEDDRLVVKWVGNEMVE